MAKNEKTKDTLFFPIYKGLPRNFKKRYRKHKTCLEDKGADGHTTLTTYFWKDIIYDIYHIIVMYMTIQVSKEAYGPQECSLLSQIIYRNMLRGKS